MSKLLHVAGAVAIGILLGTAGAAFGDATTAAQLARSAERGDLSAIGRFFDEVIAGTALSDADIDVDSLSLNGTAVTATAAELNILDGVTSTAAELNILDGVTSTAAELNILDGVTSTAAELNILDGVTSTAAELNILDGVTATAAELNDMDDSLRVVANGAGITGAGVIHSTAVIRIGELVYTRIVMDLTDLTAGGTAGDIIGGAGGAASSHIGQVTAALNGTIVAGYIDVIETPAGPAGGDDIDLYMSSDSTGAEDVAISGLAGQAQLVNAGAWSAGNRKILTTMPTADFYLYLVDQGGGNAAYTAGIFELVLIGTV